MHAFVPVCVCVFTNTRHSQRVERQKDEDRVQRTKGFLFSKWTLMKALQPCKR
jgi:hypothetical protein